MKKIVKKMIGLLGAISLLFTGCGKGQQEVKHSVPEVKAEVLSINCLAVGKADAIIVQQGEHAMLIDAGETTNGTTVVSALEKQGIEKLDALVITHYDKDHVGGAAKVLESVSVDTVFCPDYTGDNDEYLAFQRSIDKHGDVRAVSEITSYTLGDASLTIHPAEDVAEIMEKGDEHDNDLSLVIQMAYGEKKFLLTGDIEKKRTKQMLAAPVDWDCDWIKIPHHGRYQKKLKDLFEVATPTYAVISTSSAEAPEEKMTDALEEYGIETYDTMEKNVITYSDGKTIWFE